jgi:hypothetical protein
VPTDIDNEHDFDERAMMEKKKIQKKVKKVIAEFNRGDLKSSSGKPVVKKDQALAIGYSEAKKKK